MPTFRIVATVVALGAAAVPAVAQTTVVQTWPARPVTIVVPLAAGGGPDVLARILAPHLSELLGQPVLVENVPGGGGMTGSARVAKAAPDGYQAVIGNIGTHAQNQTLYKRPAYNAATDFAPVGLIAELPFVLVARPDLPAGTLQDFIAYAKANQAKMQYGSAGPGSGAHLACVLLNAAIGIDVTHVPYRSGASTLGMQDMIAGRIDYMCPTLPLAIAQIDSKTVKAPAILTRERAPRLPNLASAHEQGLTDFEAGSWNALFLPKDTPAAIVRKLNDAMVAAIAKPSVRSKIEETGAVVVGAERMSPDYLQAFVESEIRKWAAPIKATGVTAE
jgi:tripartite-type tricarboxylate transporter receptor subunit TctC